MVVSVFLPVVSGNHFRKFVFLDLYETEVGVKFKIGDELFGKDINLKYNDTRSELWLIANSNRLFLVYTTDCDTTTFKC